MLSEKQRILTTVGRKGHMPALDRERIDRAARIYASNRDASRALGIAPSSFSRLCRRYGIETPQARRRGKGLIR